MVIELFAKETRNYPTDRNNPSAQKWLLFQLRCFYLSATAFVVGSFSAGRSRIFPSRAECGFFFMLLIFIALCLPLHAQDACKTALEEAEEAFDKKLFAQAVETLTPCLPDGIGPREQRVRGYELLALSYYTLDQVELAQNAINALFGLNENYTVGPGLDAGFKTLVEKVREERSAPVIKPKRHVPKWTWWANGAALAASGVILYYVFKENAPAPIADPPKPPARP